MLQLAVKHYEENIDSMQFPISTKVSDLNEEILLQLKSNLVPIIALPTKLFYEWQVITLWIVTAVRIMVIQNGKTDKAVLILKLWFFKHLVEELGYMRRGIAKGSTAQCSKHK